MTTKHSNLIFAVKPNNKRFIDIEGQRFGQLLVLGFKESKPNSFQIWFCQCACGNITEVESYKLRTGHTKSCGCLVKTTSTENGKNNIKHGKEGTRIYNIWVGILQRCLNSKQSAYARYGGRGITVCKKWRTFEGFFEDMGEPPTKKHQIDRKNNDGNYELSNCYWATLIEQNNNKSSNKFITARGKTQTVAMWAREVKINVQTLYGRLNRGWSIERALFQNVK